MPSPDNLKADPLLPGYKWDRARRRYRDSRGRFVAQKTIRQELDRVLDGLSKDVDTLTNSFKSGQISLEKYKLEVMQKIKTANLAGAAMERGGWFQMTQSDFGRTGQIVRREYGFWVKRIKEIVSGKQKLDGTLNVRAKMYMQQGRDTFYIFSDLTMEQGGFDESLNVLNAKESCDGSGSCVEQTSYGWIRIDDDRRIQIGQRICRSNCRCNYQYRNSVSGQVETR